jgi:membrane-associated phospholipid phosphatase
LIRKTAMPRAVNYRWVVDGVRTNAVLARSDLIFNVPLRARAKHFIFSNPASAAALLSFGVFVLGMAFWRIRWILIRDKDDRDDEDHRAIRNRTLRRYSVVAGSITLVLIGVTALSALPEGGHPPLWVMVAIFAIYILALMWFGLCFLIARHLMEVARRAPPCESRRARIS